MIRSNVAACYLKLQGWEEAVDSATKSLDSLERIDPLPKTKLDQGAEGGKDGAEGENPVIEEVDESTAETIEALQRTGHTRDEVQKIRVKALMRRAKARMEMSGWANLQGAEEGQFQRVLVLGQVMESITDILLSFRLQVSFVYAGTLTTRPKDCRESTPNITADS